MKKFKNSDTHELFENKLEKRKLETTNKMIKMNIMSKFSIKSKSKKKAAEDKHARKITEFWAPKTEKSNDPQECQVILPILPGTAIPDI